MIRGGVALLCVLLMEIAAPGFLRAGRLHEASARGDVPAIRTLPGKGMSVHSRLPLNDGCAGYQALHRAVTEGRLEAVRTLLDAGADGNATVSPDGTGDTPLSLAVSSGDVAMVSLLIQRGADPGKTIIRVHHGSRDVYRHTLSLGTIAVRSIADDNNLIAVLGRIIGPGTKAEDLDSLLKQAAESRDSAVVRELIHLGAKAAPPRCTQAGSLYFALRRLAAPVLKLFGITLVNEYELNYDALHAALSSARFHEEDMIAEILTAGAQVNRKYYDRHHTPLHMAALGEGKHAIPLIKLLLDHGADINARDRFGNTPLFNTLYYGNSDALSYLVKRGAKTDLRNAKGQTILHFWINQFSSDCFGAAECARMIEPVVKAAGDVNLRDGYGETVLHAAERNGRPVMASVLRGLGAESSRRFTPMRLWYWWKNEVWPGAAKPLFLILVMALEICYLYFVIKKRPAGFAPEK